LDGELMDVGELFRLVRRRWAIAVPALLLTLVATVGGYLKLPTSYQSQVQLTMLNAPKITAEPGNFGNPYLSFDTTLSVDVDYLTRYLTSTAAAQLLKARGVTEQYTAAFANNALGPFMVLTVTGPDRVHVLQSIAVLVTFTEQQWRSTQLTSKAPTDSLVGMSVIAPPSNPKPVLKKKIEVVAGIAILGIALSILLAVFVDASVRRRRSNSRASQSRPSERRSQAAPVR
jgi:uncharacterized protein involved in exopolysaccharide biosynthesis